MHAVAALTVTRIEHTADLDQLEREWKLLVDSSGETSPFLTWTWTRTWWRSFAGTSKLFVLACRDEDGTLVGIAPLLIALRRAFKSVPARTVEFIGNHGSAVCTDHLDFLCHPAMREAVTTQLLQAVMAHRSQWDVLALGSVAPQSAIPGVLPSLAQADGGVLIEGDEEVCPWMELPESWERFVEVMKREHKSLIPNLRRKRNRLNANHQVDFVVGEALGDPNQHIETLAELHRLARMRQGGEGNFALPEYRKFHDDVVREMQAAGQLYLARLDIDQQPAAAWYGFFVPPVLSYYQSGFDTKYVKEGVGDVLLGMILEDAITRLGARGFDFLRGTEEYKFRWTSATRVDRTLRYWRPSLVARLAHREFRLRRKASAWKRKWQESRQKKAAASAAPSQPASPPAES